MTHGHKAGLALWWVCCGLAALAFLVLANWFLPAVPDRAAATSHRAPFVYNLSDCRVEKSNTQATIYSSRYLNFYVCDDGTNLGSNPSRLSYICIPFMPGTVDFQTYSLPPKEVTQAATLKRSRYPVPVYPSSSQASNTIETVSGSTVNCIKTPAFATFAIVCEFAWDTNRPSEEGPLKVEGGSLDACNLEAAWRDPPEADAIGKIAYPLNNCQVDSAVTGRSGAEFYRCSYGAATPGYEAPSLCILFTGGGEWSLQGREGQTRRYTVSVTSVAGCYDLESNIGDISGVDSATLSFAVNCGSDLFGNQKHPLAAAGFNSCNLGVDWDDSPLPGSEGGIELGDGEKFEEIIDCGTNDKDCGFLATVNSILSWMAYLVVPIVIIVIIVGGVQLSLAGDNPEATKKAKARITQAVVALICYVLLWSVLRWLL